MCWHAPIEPGCAFRRLQPSIPIETSHLFRMKPAGHSDDPSRLRCGSQADEFGLLNGLFVKPGFGGAQFSHASHLNLRRCAACASNFTYAEARWTQAWPDWIGCHVGAFASFGDVTPADRLR
jgi:hypothetical protein